MCMKKLGAEKLFIPPAKRSFRGYTVFSMSEILSANKILQYIFNIFCPILIKFIPHLHHYKLRM